jgi:hypothetical protein
MARWATGSPRTRTRGRRFALDELALLPGRLAETAGGEPVEVAHAAGGGLVEHLDGVVGEDVAVAAGALQPVAQVLGDVLGGERVDVEPPVIRECKERKRRILSWSLGSGRPTRMSERSAFESHS